MPELYNAIFGIEMVGVYNVEMEDIINQYLKSVYNYVYRIVRDENMTEDVTQETFVKVWKNLKKFDERDNLKPLLFAIARNTAIDYLRKKKNIAFSEIDSDNEENEKTFSENIPDTEPLPDEVFERKELAKELEKALSKIRPNFAEIILLHYNQGLTFEEISKIIDKPQNTVKSWHRRALHQIRGLLRI